MTVYLTKARGFSDPCGPLQFSMGGWRARARAELAPDDLVIIVGTKGGPPARKTRAKSSG